MAAAPQKVASWIDNEQHCVTTQRISQSLNLSRKRASQILEDLYDSEKHQAVVCQIEEAEQDTIPVTSTYQSRRFGFSPVSFLSQSCDSVFRLRKTTGDVKNLVALVSRKATESIATAHERDLLEWRDMVAGGRLAQSLAIAPADAILSFLDAPALIEATVQAESNPTVAPPTNTNRHKAFSGKSTKVTTAASFFGSKSKSTPAVTSEVKPPQPTNAKENKIRTNQVAPTPQKSTVGNADDFIADEEDSDDEQEKRVVRQRKQAARRKAVQEATLEEAVPYEEKVEEEEEIKVVGTMDAFATAPKQQPKPTTSTQHRKRRKKLVEETVMVNGYLRTETKAIWEDIPTDEEEEAKKNQPPVAKKSIKTQQVVKPQQGMKQKSLKGFFNKK